MTAFNDRRSVPMSPTKGTISHVKARQIAADWHGGANSPLASLATTGAIRPGVESEIAANMPEARTKKDAHKLQKLHNYVTKSGVRGPVDGWSNLNY